MHKHHVYALFKRTQYETLETKSLATEVTEHLNKFSELPSCWLIVLFETHFRNKAPGGMWDDTTQAQY